VLQNTTAGVVIEGGAHGNTVGSVVSTELSNVISGSIYGINITGNDTTGNIVIGNGIGVDHTGEEIEYGDADDKNSLGNQIGVLIDAGASGNRIGGTSDIERTVISGNSVAGVDIDGMGQTDPGTTANVVEGNFIGLSFSGKKLGNEKAGVLIKGW